MGGSASVLPDKLSEREVKAIAGEKFDQRLFDALKDTEGFITKEQLVSSANSTEKQTQEQFYRFAPDGQMTSKLFAKLCKDTKLIDNSFRNEDADIVFTAAKNKMGPASKYIDFDVFRHSAIPGIAAKRGCSDDWILILIGQAQGPVLHATKADAVRLHDDKSTYTGSHAQGGPTFEVNDSTLKDQLDRSEADVRGVKVRKQSVDQQGETNARRSSRAESYASITLSSSQEELSTGINPSAENESEARASFKKFCPEGEMDSKTFVKLCRDTKLFNNSFKQEDADLLFQKGKNKQTEKQGYAAKGLKYGIFRNVCVPIIASKRGCSELEILQILSNAEGPTYNATKALATRFHDDKSTYTGSHAAGGPNFRVEESGLADQLDRTEADVRGVKIDHARRNSVGDVTDRRLSGTDMNVNVPRASASRRSSRAEDSTAAAIAAATGATNPQRRVSNAGIAAASAADPQKRPSVANLPTTSEPAKRPSFASNGPNRAPSRSGSNVDEAALQAALRGSTDGTGAAPTRRISGTDALPPKRNSTTRSSGIESSFDRSAGAMRYGSPDPGPYQPSEYTLLQLRNVFNKFCPTGEMSSAQFIKMMKDAKVLNKHFTSGEAELIFTKAKQQASGGGSVAQGQKVPFPTFCSVCIPIIADKRGESVEAFVNFLIGSEGPVLNATHADAVRFHDDKSTYTGSHAAGGPNFRVEDKGRLDTLLDRSDADVRGVKRGSIGGV